VVKITAKISGRVRCMCECGCTCSCGCGVVYKER